MTESNNTAEYNTQKKVFELLSKKAKELKLTEIGEHFNESNEQEVYGFLAHPQKDSCFQVSIREVDKD